MAVSRRLRFEILRRDNHTCRYCGSAAPDVKLTVDHVTPKALGGNDEPDNLVTACQPCNAGKASIAPDAAIVDGVSDDALRWAAAKTLAAKSQMKSRQEVDAFCRGWYRTWAHWFREDLRESPSEIGLPDDWAASIETLYNRGLEPEWFDYAIRTAQANQKVYLSGMFRYHCGICWNVLREREDMAPANLAVEEAG